MLMDDLAKTNYLVEQLKNLEHPSGQTELVQKNYNLKVGGKEVCARAFDYLHNMSYNTLRKIANPNFETTAMMHVCNKYFIL